jgi:rhodanese-related sulfurtransferase
MMPVDPWRKQPDAVDRTWNRASRLRTVSAMTDAVAHFAARLRFETDASDVRAAQLAGERFVLVDSRGDAAWAQGRAVGAVHVERTAIAAAGIPVDVPVVVYCWGPGCNGATKAALAFAEAGYAVRELLGGFEYWAREGLPVETDEGRIDRVPDPLTAPVGSIVCDC